MSNNFRPHKEFESLTDIIKHVNVNPHNKMIWVGKDYSKYDLVRDLKKMEKECT